MIESVNSFAGKWFDFMVNSSIQLTVLFIVLFLLSYIYRKRSAHFLYSLWIIFLIKALLPPSISIPLIKNSTIIPQISIQSYPSFAALSLTEAVDKNPAFQTNSILLLLWIGIITSIFGFFLLKNIFFRKRLQQAQPIEHPISEGCLERDKHEFSRIRFYIQERISSPFTVNLRNPRIYLPPDWYGWEDKQKQAVILHEFAHIKRKDLWINLIQNIIQIFYFFHPVVWMANRYISAYREQVCDDYVISRLKNKSLEYCKMILSSLDRSRGSNRYSSLINCFVQDRRALIKRFEYLINRKEEIMQKFKVTEKFVLGVLCVFALVLSLRSVERSSVLQEKMITRKNPGAASKEYYVRYDTPPTPLKGFCGLAESVSIPEKTVLNKVEGAVYVTVDINKSGNTELSNDISTSGDCGILETKAVIDTLKPSKWNPAVKKGNPIDAEMELIFVFKLNEDTNKICVEVIPPPPPPPLPPRPPKPEASPLAKKPPLPPVKASPKDNLIPSPQKPLRPNVPLQPNPPPPPKPTQPIKSETLVLSSAAPLPEMPPPPDKATPVPPPPPDTPWNDPAFLTDRVLDKQPEPIIGIENLTKDIHYSENYKTNKRYAKDILIAGVLIDETGQLNAVLVLHSSGYRELDQTIIDHLSAAEWKPGEKDGKPVKSKTTFTFTFKD